MATVYWAPKALARAQISSGTITGVDATPANNDFTVTINGVAVTVAGITDANTTAEALVTALGGNLHPYFTAVSWSAPGAGVVRGESLTPGVPFAATLSETGAGTGAVTDFSTSQAATSPHHVSDPQNYSDDTLPTTGDTLIIDSAVSMLWALDALSAVALAAVYRNAGSARIGLDSQSFNANLDSSGLGTGMPEYRPHYLEVSAPLIVTGRVSGIGQPSESNRVKIRNTLNAASVCRVEGTSNSNDSGRPAFRYLVTHASATLEVLRAPGGAGLAADEPGETSQVSLIHLLDATGGSGLVVGRGATYATYRQDGGRASISAAANVTLIDMRGGQLDIQGEDYTIASLIVRGGTAKDRHVQSTGAEWTLITTEGGTLDLTGAGEARTATELDPNGGTIIADWPLLTITTLNLPAGPRASITINPA